MAAPMNRIWVAAVRGAYRIRPRARPAPPAATFRHFHPSRRRCADDDKRPEPTAPKSSSSTPPDSTPQEVQSEAQDTPGAPRPPASSLSDLASQAENEVDGSVEGHENAAEGAQESKPKVSNEGAEKEAVSNVKESAAEVEVDNGDGDPAGNKAESFDIGSFHQIIAANETQELFSDDFGKLPPTKNADGSPREGGELEKKVLEQAERMINGTGGLSDEAEDLFGGAAEGPQTEEEVKHFLENPPDDMRADLEELMSRMKGVENELARELKNELGDDAGDTRNFVEKQRPPRPGGLLDMGDEDEPDRADDEVFEGDDMTSLGHGDLERHREMREYARIAAWDMPLLAKYAKPFEPPTAESPLRFRYTSYMGETHPAEPKVVVEFCTGDLPLEPRQRLKLVKLLGPRYNPQKDLARMSCEKFQHSTQNKRYLLDLVNTLIKEAKCESAEEGGKDLFDDVPVDFRHVKWKPKLEFPEEWKMTPERLARLREGWRKGEEAEQRRIEEGKHVDGLAAIEERNRRVAETVHAGRLPSLLGERL